MLSGAKIISLIFLLAVLDASAFLPVAPPPPGMSRIIALSANKIQQQNQQEEQAHQDGIVAEFQHKWAEEEARLKAYENAVLNDPDLENVVEHPAVGMKNEKYMEKEAHRHDSFSAEVEHSIDNDPYLTGIVKDDDEESSGSAHLNPGFMEREAHKHDSLWSEIEYSIRNDPDLI
jgi:hypothetical protein